MTGVHLPKLSEYDPVTSAEGALDPLGLYAIADSLALRLVPGIRERMSHPRFLTAIAAGNVFTRLYDDDELAADAQSQPYLVYEWHVVEGIVRTRGDDSTLSGLPGVLKARECIRDGLNLSASRYLKTATVFGFNGVYRLLASNLDIIRDGFLGGKGYELLTTWEKEQGLQGFITGTNGPGLRRRTQIHSAVQDAMSKGAVTRSTSWDGWDFFGDHLFPNEIPQKETEVLQRLFLSEKDSHRAEVIRFLISSKGSNIYQNTNSERNFHTALRTNSGKATHQLLDAIEAYETFSRLLQDAFDDCLAAMTKKRDRISPKELSREEGCKKAYREVPEMFQKVSDFLEHFDQAIRFNENFGSFAEAVGAEEWTRMLLDHHVKVQRKKPPNGKNPWFERFDDNTVVIRAGYRRMEGGQNDASYVHAYRTKPLWSFFSDLRML
jgi:hypothetical protein